MLSIFNNSACNLFDIAVNKTCTQTHIHQCHVNTAKSITIVTLFHQRFGHPNKHILKRILSSIPPHYLVSLPDLCDVCRYGKIHQSPFYSTSIKTKASLELVHTNLWGPVIPLASLNNYRYYISFIYDYIMYCWICL